ncbi:hypothetical protein [Nocardia flavorosea]|uniref:Uncharacterized protein n=1 Tax=Nocardia flavorosea TaxID=53429 RepID=A0A846YCW1_9NOCA|nr:hypothetical protein [Nocardia flavorosea]NKY55651.1 hypothetical protein [Nocardia flavorosea]
MASEVERIGEESRRYAEHMVARMAEAKARREAENRQVAEQWAAEMNQFWQEMAEYAAGQEGNGRDQPVDAGDRPHEHQAPPAERQSGAEPFRLREIETHQSRDQELRRQQETFAPHVTGGGSLYRSYETGSLSQPVQGGELDAREAIARSAAARRRNNIVAPVDDDGDDEAKYYQRGSWLV